MLQSLRIFGASFGRPQSSGDTDEVIRGEIFSAERLELHAESLAARQPAYESYWGWYDLAAEARRNGSILLECHSAIAEAARDRRAITPAAEWLLDNFHVIDEQLKCIHQDCTQRLVRSLPKLADGPHRGRPRVYGLVWDFVAHTDSGLDVELLKRFVHAYQRITPLSMRELWAVSLVLRCIMVDNLRRLAVRIVGSQAGRRDADRVADELEGADRQAPPDLSDVLRGIAQQSVSRAFAVQLAQRLRYRDLHLPVTLRALNERLAEQGVTWERLIQLEHASQSAANLTVRNLVTSMRAMSAFDWPGFFEEVSLVDARLRKSSAFSRMDFLTRDRYRHALEELAKGSQRSELDVATALLGKTQHADGPAATSDSPEDPWRDPGYFLISTGRVPFEREIGYRTSVRNRLLRGYVAHAAQGYLGGIAIVTLLLAAVPLWMSRNAGVSPGGLLLLGLLAVVPLSEVAVTLINRWVTRTLPPRHLPRLDLKDGVPPSLRTFVVVPTMLTGESAVAESVQRLEIHFLSNPDADVRFGLLSDWSDADAESMPNDARLFQLALQGVASLNQRHGPAADGGQRFFLFHRCRRWSETQRKWMGWERKRGKLHEFNRLLQGASDTSFLPLDSDGRPPNPPSGVRYVITLDADTRLPIAAVRQLVGTAAHPLNRPRADPATGRIGEGYAVLQPRIAPRLPARKDSSVFQRLFSARPGVDAYAAAVSDVYQDLFDEGSYTGKGLYDVAAFEAALAGRVPENAVLSHDLLEGIFARCALVSDVELFEDFPSHSEVAATRTHRWTRGDWQLLPWIFGRAGHAIPAIGRWKLLDNLRRSLVAPACLAMLVASWSVPHAPWLAWLVATLLALCLPALLSVVDGLLPPRAGGSLPHHFRMVLDDLRAAAVYLLVSLTYLAQQTWLVLDAIVRTLWRLFVSRRQLLEWMTAAQVQSSTGLALENFLWPLRSAGVVAFGATASVLYFNPVSVPIAAPFILLWWASPLIARAISLPPQSDATKPLGAWQARELRLIARRTWHFFTTFVTAEEHWLPPDNFQEDPHPVVAHRTSPTNIGLYLLSTVTARDFGWLGLQDMVDRLEATLKSMHALPRHSGHFLNWYDTRSLEALAPRYISSVDSGNLAGHLIALEEACRSMLEKPVYGTSSLSGIADAVLILRQAIATASDQRRTMTVDVAQLHAALDEVEKLVGARPGTASQWDALWWDLEVAAGTLLDIAQTFADERADAADSEVLAWTRALHADVTSQRKEMRLLPRWSDAGTPGAGAGALQAAAREPASTQTMPIPALRDIAAECMRLIATIHGASESTVMAGRRAADRIADLEACARESTDLVERLTGIAVQARQLFDEMDFTFLFDPRRKLFSVGYRVSEAALDESYYDLLASEARLASFIAIAKGEVPVSHWFRLGRPMVPIEDGGALISWSGSMFEYLMPSLIMRTPSQSLLDGTCRLVVERQIEYGLERGVPWGVSESAYSQRDRQFTYQYAAFGVPGLGFKRGLGQDLVIAPYATALAAMYDPLAAADNFSRLERAGGRGAYGFYEALDFTPARLPENDRVAVVRAYMAHHQGMSLLALANVLLDGTMRRRFHRHPMVQAAELLLEERTPREIVAARIPEQETAPATVVQLVPTPAREFRTARLPSPATHLLSNGRYSVMITSAGSGYSTWEELAITRWREDPTCDVWGNYLFLRDTASGEVWSAGTQPTAKEPDRYEAVFSEDRARIHRADGSISTLLEVIVSPEDDAEIRRLSITNHGLRVRELQITSYLEVVLAAGAADLAHPAFSNLFVQTEFVAEVRGLVATRRPRKASDPVNWAAHVLAVSSESHGVIEYETDRARFLGRNRTVRSPVSVMDGRPLSNTVGEVLDPILSLRTRVRIAAGATVHLAFATMVASTREQLLSLADKYHDPAAFGRISMLAWTHAQVQRHHLGVGADEANLFQYLANGLLYFDATLRAASETIARTTGNVSGLWRHGISGDRPIVLVRIDDPDDREIVRQVLRAHEYWRSKCLAVDVVFLNEKGASYSQDLQALLEKMVQASQPTPPPDRAPQWGSLFVLSAVHLTAEEVDLLHRAARVILVSKHGSLAEQVGRMRKSRATLPPPAPRTFWPGAGEVRLPTPKLDFFNGLGGFTEDGREYVTVLRERQSTPAPWVNIIANEQFGFLVSEAGSGCTWCLNSHENQITPWSNDPVSDWSGEALYIRDEDSGWTWGPTALPIRVEGATYIAWHGQGFSRFEHQSHGIHSELVQFVAVEDAVKISALTLENRSPHYRELSITQYVEWVLGPSRTTGAPFIVTEVDPDTGALFARNPWNAEFGNRVAFLDMAGRQTAWTGDRREFIGRNGTLERPLALSVDSALSGRVGGDLDPCGVLSSRLSLAPGERSQVVFFLGQAADRPAARRLIERYRGLDPAAALAQVAEAWDRTLNVTQVQTPERALDFMLNRWLLYQTLSCRIWGRAGFYQPGGAYGFRDQLQDCMAIMGTRPELAREHLLRAAGRQFLEGDVQHWWHPPSGRGVRTHCSDDRVWLPFAVARYIEMTGDTQILDERLPFLEGPLLVAEQEDAYFEPVRSMHDGTLHEHCVRALDRSLATGPHGLPLIGSGDWNDGMNRVGHAGNGESVWLGWFLHATLERYAVLTAERGELQRADGWRQHAADIKAAIEKEAWDGAWYRRAYFDDGTPLGSASAAECRIDSLAQSWSVISGAGDPQRSQRAMRSVEEYLIRFGDDLVLLLTPPFDKTPLDPGYIKGYPPGVRENGGQYTHAAVWCAIAYAIQGEGESAAELLRMLNPINRASTRAGVHAYKVEPYVVAADIYSVPPHTRRGGWTWYTGAAGWMYRAGIEWMLGIRKLGNTLSIDPCIPGEWPGFQLRYRHRETLYRIAVENPHNVMRGVVQIELDGKRLEPANSVVTLSDDGLEHDVRVVLG